MAFPTNPITEPGHPLTREGWLDLYRAMRCCRAIDETQASLAQRGEAPFFVGSAGHEASAMFAALFGPQDWLMCHYRDTALALARGMAPEVFFLSLLGKSGSPSEGRRMPGFPHDARLRILSTPTVVGSGPLHAVGVAAQVRDMPERPLVYCAIGDGGTQQGEFTEAVAEAVRANLPVLFVVQDNQIALSTPTAGATFYSLPGGEADSYYGIPVQRVDGTDPHALYQVAADMVSSIRQDRGPALLVMRVERLGSHSNADDHTVYRPTSDLDALTARDPLPRMRALLAARADIAETDLDAVDRDVETTVRQALESARAAAEPTACLTARAPLPPDLGPGAEEYSGDPDQASVTMLEALRGVLDLHLKANPAVRLDGQDIGDPKGDVFGLTRGLGRAHGDRVANAPLSESTIIGAAIGRALAGARPVAMLQFADFMPMAYNQLACELSTLHWRTNGDWSAPVLVMAICGGYRPGLGPFHAQTPAATLAHLPGLDVLVPSTAGDAAGLLQAALRSPRPTVFLYPKSLINDRHRLTSPDLDRHLVPIGRARIVRTGGDLTLVSYGSTMPLVEDVAARLAEDGLHAEVIDLRSISPWDADTVCASAARTGRLLVVHEENATCGIGGEILATVAERHPEARLARVAQLDTHVPFHFANQLEVLPSYERILERAADLLDHDVAWEQAAEAEEGVLVVKAIGSSPSDQAVTLTEWHVAEGDTVDEGDLLASAEADKAATEIRAPVAGEVEALVLDTGVQVEIGTPMLRLRPSRPAGGLMAGPPARAQARLVRRLGVAPEAALAATPATRGAVTVYLTTIASRHGGKVMDNEAILADFPDWDSEDVRRRTGIERRHWLAEGESVLTLALDACRKALGEASLQLWDLGAIICSTGTPLGGMTPSLACRILHDLSPDDREVLVQAHDVNAACSGYLYALQQAYDLLQQSPDRPVLLVTAEALSPLLDPKDPSTLFLFGDAATATVLGTAPRDGVIQASLHRPVLSAKGEEPEVLCVPFPDTGEYVGMEGAQVFRTAVRKLVDILDAACRQARVGVGDLDLVIPHQANARIIEAVRKIIEVPPERMLNQVARLGNTSSNTIPLALESVLPGLADGAHVGLTAFGGGFTFGAGVLDIVRR